MEDNDGREYARLDKLKKGDTILVDDGFSCMEPWSMHLVEENTNGLYVLCTDGSHYLEGQMTQDKVLIGIYQVEGE
jgi:hypothetical protein